MAADLGTGPRVSRREKRGAGATILMVGLGNIGSQVVEHLARLPGVMRVVLVDPGRYDAANRRSQAIAHRDAGRSKALVQARRLHAINPRLLVTALTERVELLPLGALRADLILTGLDSRAARQSVNRIAWRLGVPWIDAGVRADGLLARIAVYDPLDAVCPCLECPWGEVEYAGLEQVLTCAAGKNEPAPTNAPSSLGSLAAAVEVLEAGKLLAGERHTALIGREVVIGVQHHRHFVSRRHRNAECRFDHETWAVTPLGRAPDELTVQDLLQLASRQLNAPANSLSLAVEGRNWVARSRCFGCGASREDLHLQGRLSPVDRLCPACGRALEETGWDMSGAIAGVDFPPALRGSVLEKLGVRAGDVISAAGPSRTAHFEIKCPAIQTVSMRGDRRRTTTTRRGGER